MTYLYEKDLQLDLSTIVASQNRRNSIGFFRREIPIGECIPDLVYVEFRAAPILEKIPQRWSNRHSYLIWLLKKWNRLTLSEISDLYFVSETKIKPLINDLVKTKMIIEDDNYFSLSNWVSSIQAEVVSYEAKLYRWKEALKQCIRYSAFSDRTYVVMDKDGVPSKASILHDFEENNIGLCVINNNKLEILVNPKNNIDLGFEKEYIIFSTLIPSRQIFWSFLNSENAFSQA